MIHPVLHWTITVSVCFSNAYNQPGYHFNSEHKTLLHYCKLPGYNFKFTFANCTLQARNSQLIACSKFLTFYFKACRWQLLLFLVQHSSLMQCTNRLFNACRHPSYSYLVHCMQAVSKKCFALLIHATIFHGRINSQGKNVIRFFSSSGTKSWEEYELKQDYYKIAYKP